MVLGFRNLQEMLEKQFFSPSILQKNERIFQSNSTLASINGLKKKNTGTLLYIFGKIEVRKLVLRFFDIHHGSNRPFFGLSLIFSMSKREFLMKMHTAFKNDTNTSEIILLQYELVCRYTLQIQCSMQLIPLGSKKSQNPL